jgi:hypothetical protein
MHWNLKWNCQLRKHIYRILSKINLIYGFSLLAMWVIWVNISITTHFPKRRGVSMLLKLMVLASLHNATTGLCSQQGSSASIAPECRSKYRWIKSCHQHSWLNISWSHSERQHGTCLSFSNCYSSHINHTELLLIRGKTPGLSSHLWRVPRCCNLDHSATASCLIPAHIPFINSPTFYWKLRSGLVCL